jgi:hypothetical protein
LQHNYRIEVAIEEMPPKERVNIAMKLAALCQRYKVVRRSAKQFLKSRAVVIRGLATAEGFG